MLSDPGPTSSTTETRARSPGADSEYSGQLFYPFTFPLTVGPGCVAVALTLSAHTSRGHVMATAMSQLGALAGILAVAVITYFCIARAGRLTERLGQSGTSVLMRLSAFIVICLGAEISWRGVQTLLGPAVAAG